MLDLDGILKPRTETIKDIFINTMNFFNFNQKDMINSEDKIEYAAYVPNLMNSVKEYFDKMGMNKKDERQSS